MLPPTAVVSPEDGDQKRALQWGNENQDLDRCKLEGGVVVLEWRAGKAIRDEQGVQREPAETKERRRLTYGRLQHRRRILGKALPMLMLGW